MEYQADAPFDPYLECLPAVTATSRYAEQEETDAGTRYLWVRKPIRLEAKAIRDSILAVSGQLNPAMGGPPFFPESNDEQMERAGTWWEPSSREERNRRTIYMLQIRSFPLPMIKLFDGPNMDESCVVRGITTVTPQVFSLFNSKFSHDQSRAMANRIIAEVGEDPERQIGRAFRLAFMREPVTLSRQKLERSSRQAAVVPVWEQKAAVGQQGGGSLSDLCLILLNTNEFVFLD